MSIFHLDLVALSKLAGYPGIALIVFLESGVPIGFFLPGASMLFTAGLLSSQGFFNPLILIPLVTVAAILGDNAGYWFGARIGSPLLERSHSRWIKHEHVVMARDFYEKHGVLSIVLARFVPIVRTFAPIIAGVATMRYRSFVFYNVIGALLWASGVTFLGYYLGEKVPAVEHYLTPIILLIIAASLIPVVREIYRHARRARS